MFVEISLDSLCRLYGSAALGKLMGGLVHNLNGPLQNLGMDLEMMIYSLADTDPSRDSPSKGLGTRLKRMETELDAIIAEAIREAGAMGVRDMGKVMKILMPKVTGKADGKTVGEKVKLILSA